MTIGMCLVGILISLVSIVFSKVSYDTVERQYVRFLKRMKIDPLIDSNWKLTSIWKREDVDSQKYNQDSVLKFGEAFLKYLYSNIDLDKSRDSQSLESTHLNNII
jgi:hypothetical protein